MDNLDNLNDLGDRTSVYLAGINQHQSSIIPYPERENQIINFIPLKCDLEPFKPVKHDVEPFKPLKCDVKPFKPLKCDVEPFKPLKCDVEPFKPLKCDVEPFKLMKHDAEPFKPLQCDVEEPFKPLQCDVVEPFKTLKCGSEPFKPLHCDVGSVSHDQPTCREDKKELAIFVANLDDEIDEDFLRQVFSYYGTVGQVVVMRERTTGKSRNWGYVTYAGLEEAKTAVTEMYGTKLGNHRIKVKMCNKVTS